MNNEIQKCIDAATTKRQSHYIDPSMMEPKPIYKPSGEPVYYDHFDRIKFAFLIIQKCINVIEQCEGDTDWAIYKIQQMFDGD